MENIKSLIIIIIFYIAHGKKNITNIHPIRIIKTQFTNHHILDDKHFITITSSSKQSQLIFLFQHFMMIYIIGSRILCVSSLEVNNFMIFEEHTVRLLSDLSVLMYRIIKISRCLILLGTMTTYFPFKTHLFNYTDEQN